MTSQAQKNPQNPEAAPLRARELPQRMYPYQEGHHRMHQTRSEQTIMRHGSGPVRYMEEVAYSPSPLKEVSEHDMYESAEYSERVYPHMRPVAGNPRQPIPGSVKRIRVRQGMPPGYDMRRPVHRPPPQHEVFYPPQHGQPPFHPTYADEYEAVQYQPKVVYYPVYQDAVPPPGYVRRRVPPRRAVYYDYPVDHIYPQERMVLQPMGQPIRQMVNNYHSQRDVQSMRSAAFQSQIVKSDFNIKPRGENAPKRKNSTKESFYSPVDNFKQIPEDEEPDNEEPLKRA